MHTHNFLDVIDACRFCFMCRHIATTANVTFREADIPRGRALILDRVRMNPEQLNNPDYIRTMYDCALSAACRKHCVSDYDETGLVLAARRDIVEAGLAPTKVQALADAIVAEFAPTVEGDSGDVLYVRNTSENETGEAFGKAMAAAGIAYRTLRVNDTGKAVAVLGFADKAKEMHDKLRAAIAATGCSTVVATCPAAFDALKNDIAAPDGVAVQHSATFLLGLIESGQLAVEPASRAAFYIDSDFLRNYNDIEQEPRALLGACGCRLRPFGTNPEESYACGEGAVVLDQLRPKLTGMLRDRVVQFMDSADDLIVTASPYTRRVLAEAGIRVLSIEEAVVGQEAVAKVE